ncbi:MAG: glycosyltransferase [Syntrophobacteraceae bacterium]
MKILFYCQHVLGIGHFFRSMEVARALSRHTVVFVLGGAPLSGFIPPGHVKVLSLPALMMDPEFKSLHVQEGSLEDIRQSRRRMLMDLLVSFDPDLILTELFPFGRRQFRFELTPLLKAAKQRSVPAKIVCSLRDILVEKKEKPNYETEVVETLNSYYDLLLIHSDPRVVRLEETFGRCGEIGVQVEYTGFVARPPIPRRNPDGKKVIVASSGGGRVGVDLLCAAIEAVRRVRRTDLELRVFIGPFLEKVDEKRMEYMASDDPRIRLLPFSLDFVYELSMADLSISMAGYNTCMDILSSGVPALVYPFPQNREQGIRAARLEEFGALKVLPTFEAKSLVLEIESFLKQDRVFPVPEIDITGAANSARLIEKLCTCS